MGNSGLWVLEGDADYGIGVILEIELGVKRVSGN